LVTGQLSLARVINEINTYHTNSGINSNSAVKGNRNRENGYHDLSI